MQIIGRLREADSWDPGFYFTRRWAIPVQYETIEDFWWDRWEWLGTPYNAEPCTILVDIYPGGDRFMTRVARVFRQRGFNVKVRYRDLPIAGDGDVYVIGQCARILPTQS